MMYEYHEVHTLTIVYLIVHHLLIGSTHNMHRLGIFRRPESNDGGWRNTLYRCVEAKNNKLAMKLLLFKRLEYLFTVV